MRYPGFSVPLVVHVMSKMEVRKHRGEDWMAEGCEKKEMCQEVVRLLLGKTEALSLYFS